MEAIQKPVLVINPVDDRRFAASAEALVDEGVTEIGDFRARLRVGYPKADVHVREIVAEPVLIWYVYRDGRWVNAHSGGGQSGASSADDQSTRRPEGYGAVDPSRRKDDRRARGAESEARAH